MGEWVGRGTIVRGGKRWVGGWVGGWVGRCAYLDAVGWDASLDEDLLVEGTVGTSPTHPPTP